MEEAFGPRFCRSSSPSAWRIPRRPVLSGNRTWQDARKTRTRTRARTRVTAHCDKAAAQPGSQAPAQGTSPDLPRASHQPGGPESRRHSCWRMRGSARGSIRDESRASVKESDMVGLLKKTGCCSCRCGDSQEHDRPCGHHADGRAVLRSLRANLEQLQGLSALSLLGIF